MMMGEFKCPECGTLLQCHDDVGDFEVEAGSGPVGDYYICYRCTAVIEAGAGIAPHLTKIYPVEVSVMRMRLIAWKARWRN